MTKRKTVRRRGSRKKNTTLKYNGNLNGNERSCDYSPCPSRYECVAEPNGKFCRFEGRNQSVYVPTDYDSLFDSLFASEYF